MPNGETKERWVLQCQSEGGKWADWSEYKELSHGKANVESHRSIYASANFRLVHRKTTTVETVIDEVVPDA